MNIAYVANPADNHDCKWINKFAESHNTFLICSSACKNEKKLYVKNDSIRLAPILPDQFPYKNPARLFSTKRRLKKFIEANGIEIMHSMYAYPNAFYPYLAGFENHVVTTRGSDLLIDYGRTFKNPESLKQKFAYGYMGNLLEKSLRRAAYITSTSLSQRKVILDIIDDSEKSLVVRTGLDTHLIDEYAEEYLGGKASAKKTGEDLTIFSPRNMKPVYNIELVLEGVKIFREKYGRKNLRLVQIDDAPGSAYSESIRKMIEDWNLTDNVVLLESQKLRQMVANYLRADLVLMAPKSDGTPNTALEAMYLKKPLIMGNLEYDADIFNEETVWKLRENTAPEVARAIFECVSADSTRVNKKIENARAKVLESATLGAALERVQGLYERMLAGDSK